MDRTHRNFVICIDNSDYPASLQVRKVYLCLSDAGATEHGLIRVVDESGEDYLFPEDRFVRIELPRQAAKAFATAA